MVNKEEKYPLRRRERESHQKGTTFPGHRLAGRAVDWQYHSYGTENKMQTEAKRKSMPFSSGTGDLNFLTVIEVPSKLQFFSPSGFL